ncbi:sugar ABC transporter substrate-binding protein [Enterococcus faecium]|nr:sugar ABC transporter substrate-binding protein [Enterococcus faecium]EKG9126545.1 sugar ABC transporter substrate-binding protein [Enterococcus faecium]
MKKNSLKKVISLGIFVGCAALFLSGCSRENGSSGGKEEIRISWWGGDTRNEAIQEAIKQFEKKNPDIKVKAEFGGWSGYQQKLTTQLSGGTASDVVRLDSMWLDQYQNQLLDLNDVKDDIGLSNFKELDSATLNDRILGLPLSVNYRPIYANQTLLDEYGLSVPTSWDEIIAMREKLPDDVYPLWFGAITPKGVGLNFLLTILSQQTGKSIGDVDNKLIYSEEDFKNALQFYNELVEKKITPSKEVIDNAGIVDGAPNPMITGGKVVLTDEYTASTSTLENQLKEKNYKLSLVGFPTMDGQKSNGVWTKPAMFYSIPTSSKHPKAAAKLINYLMNDPEANKIQKIENGVPVSVVGRETLESEKLIPELTESATVLGDEMVDNNLTYSYRWERARINDTLLDVVNGLGYRDMTVDEAAKILYKAFKEEESTFETAK